MAMLTDSAIFFEVYSVQYSTGGCLWKITCLFESLALFVHVWFTGDCHVFDVTLGSRRFRVE